MRSKTFRFFDTPEQAAEFVKRLGRKKSTTTPWRSTDGTERKTIVWYYI